MIEYELGHEEVSPTAHVGMAMSTIVAQGAQQQHLSMDLHCKIRVNTVLDLPLNLIMHAIHQSYSCLYVLLGFPWVRLLSQPVRNYFLCS